MLYKAVLLAALLGLAAASKKCDEDWPKKDHNKEDKEHKDKCSKEHKDKCRKEEKSCKEDKHKAGKAKVDSFSLCTGMMYPRNTGLYPQVGSTYYANGNGPLKSSSVELSLPTAWSWGAPFGGVTSTYALYDCDDYDEDGADALAYLVEVCGNNIYGTLPASVVGEMMVKPLPTDTICGYELVFEEGKKHNFKELSKLTFGSKVTTAYTDDDSIDNLVGGLKVYIPNSIKFSDPDLKVVAGTGKLNSARKWVSDIVVRYDREPLNEDGDLTIVGPVVYWGLRVTIGYKKKYYNPYGL